MTISSHDYCQFLEWDTQFFGHRIARIQRETLTHAIAQSIDTWCLDNEIACVYFLASSTDSETVRLAEDHGYRLVDIRHVYEIGLHDYMVDKTTVDAFDIRIATEDDLSALQKMIDNAFIQTRFFYDEHFTDEQANSLYQTWLERSVTDNFSDRVFVMNQNDVPIGFVTCDIDADTKVGTIGLIGIAEDGRGKALGTKLTAYALSFFQKEGMNHAQVATQARSIGANRLYQKCGFRIKHVNLWYHKWF